MVKMLVDVERTMESLRSDERGGREVVYLKSSDDEGRIVPIVIGNTEALSIYCVLSGEPAPRPLTHDLVKSMLEQFDATVEETKIVALKSHVFYAVLTIKSRGETYNFDARPSDGIALALRFGAPILMAGDVIREAGFPEGEDAEDAIEAMVEAEAEIFEEQELENFEEVDVQELEEFEEPEGTDVKSRIKRLTRQMQRASGQERYEEASRIRDQINQLKETRPGQ